MRPLRPLPALRPRMRRRQRGVMLLEALIAILIFSVGVLGLVGLQASAVKQSTEARMRADAAQLAEQLIGQMWGDNRAVGNLKAKYETCTDGSCTGYTDWAATVSNTLPGATITSPTMRPSVAVNDEGIVTISIYWNAVSDDPAAARHQYNVETQIVQ
ncbi:type IV pilus modification protein PilV [Ramlibacter sp.]|uniref:type IV pilus modification protein PilV n=1 Tax=Ramlibacter sp. TaxID=1917967 RepID=UPI002D7FFD9C|nr:type IV pilus modification protein PilV [Ramlibacter sp.]